MPRRKYSISSLPYMLVLHLKRFSQCPYTGDSKKIEDIVSFMYEDFDMSYFLTKKLPEQPQNQPSKYTLYAISNQRGSLVSGHYTSYVRRYGKWFLCNDQKVTPVPEYSILSEENYILFYFRQDIKSQFGM